MNHTVTRGLTLVSLIPVHEVGHYIAARLMGFEAVGFGAVAEGMRLGVAYTFNVEGAPRWSVAAEVQVEVMQENGSIQTQTIYRPARTSIPITRQTIDFTIEGVDERAVPLPNRFKKLKGQGVKALRYGHTLNLQGGGFTTKIMDEIREKINKNMSVVICATGPPGLGKTYFGIRFAQKLDKESLNHELQLLQFHFWIFSLKDAPEHYPKGPRFLLLQLSIRPNL